MNLRGSYIRTWLQAMLDAEAFEDFRDEHLVIACSKGEPDPSFALLVERPAAAWQQFRAEAGPELHEFAVHPEARIADISGEGITDDPDALKHFAREIANGHPFASFLESWLRDQEQFNLRALLGHRLDEVARSKGYDGLRFEAEGTELPYNLLVLNPLALVSLGELEALHHTLRERRSPEEEMPF